MVEKNQQFRNGLLVDGVEEYMNSYREEIAQEFGVYRAAGESDQITQNATRKVIDQMKKKDR
ncbi:small, acid-soluble spore protein, alpha/beta type [Alteribacter populi]|uniref:small, acid-soluble spore protein, alpha/beta type n=1 Tax=Alteribacter populi TaxID=2011011 RepID=UPI000BBB5ED6|nr:small, acid-soluble spore protein, alpha/beta type [Alteribacter populi]